MLDVMIRDVREQTFGERVRKAREEQLRITQPQAAEQAGLGIDTWRAAERGSKPRRGVDPGKTRRPSRLTVVKIAQLFGWKTDEALRWAGYDEPEAEPEKPVARDELLGRVEAAWPRLPTQRKTLVVLLTESLADQNTPPPGGLVGPDPDVRYTQRVIDTPREDTPPPIPARRDDNHNR